MSATWANVDVVIRVAVGGEVELGGLVVVESGQEGNVVGSDVASIGEII